MELSTIQYIYDKDNQVVEIRTRLMNHDRPLYVIQYPCKRENPSDCIRYRTKFVSKTLFYQ